MPPLAFAAQTQMSNADVVGMVGAGLPADVIVTAVQQAPRPAFDVSASGLIGLAKSKVPQPVIAAMQKAMAARSAPSSPARAGQGPGAMPSRDDARRQVENTVMFTTRVSTTLRVGLNCAGAPTDLQFFQQMQDTYLNPWKSQQAELELQSTNALIAAGYVSVSPGTKCPAGTAGVELALTAKGTAESARGWRQTSPGVWTVPVGARRVMEIAGIRQVSNGALAEVLWHWQPLLEGLPINDGASKTIAPFAPYDDGWRLMTSDFLDGFKSAATGREFAPISFIAPNRIAELTKAGTASKVAPTGTAALASRRPSDRSVVLPPAVPAVEETVVKLKARTADDVVNTEPVGTRSRFPRTAAQVALYYEVRGNSAGQMVEVFWVPPDGKEMFARRDVIDVPPPGQFLWFRAILKPGVPLQSGDWRADVYVDGRLAAAVPFSVR